MDYYMRVLQSTVLSYQSLTVPWFGHSPLNSKHTISPKLAGLCMQYSFRSRREMIGTQGRTTEAPLSPSLALVDSGKGVDHSSSVSLNPRTIRALLLIPSPLYHGYLALNDELAALLRTSLLPVLLYFHMQDFPVKSHTP